MVLLYPVIHLPTAYLLAQLTVGGEVSHSGRRPYDHTPRCHHRRPFGRIHSCGTKKDKKSRSCPIAPPTPRFFFFFLLLVSFNYHRNLKTIADLQLHRFLCFFQFRPFLCFLSLSLVVPDPTRLTEPWLRSPLSTHSSRPPRRRNRIHIAGYVLSNISHHRKSFVSSSNS